MSATREDTAAAGGGQSQPMRGEKLQKCSGDGLSSVDFVSVSKYALWNRRPRAVTSMGRWLPLRPPQISDTCHCGAIAVMRGRQGEYRGLSSLGRRIEKEAEETAARGWSAVSEASLKREGSGEKSRSGGESPNHLDNAENGTNEAGHRKSESPSGVLAEIIEAVPSTAFLY